MVARRKVAAMLGCGITCGGATGMIRGAGLHIEEEERCEGAAMIGREDTCTLTSKATKQHQQKTKQKVGNRYVKKIIYIHGWENPYKNYFL